MNIVIFGATGGTGRKLIEQALAQGHKVTAFDRNPSALTLEHSQLSIVEGDVFNPDQVEAAVTGQDVVISVLGVKPTTTLPVCSKGTENIITAMQKTGVKRLICQTAFTVAALDGEKQEVTWMLPVILPLFPKVKAMFQDKVRQEEIICRSNLEWIIVRPARLTDGPRLGTYKIGAPLPMGMTARIARADVADFMLKQVDDNAYVHQVPRLSY